LENSFPSFTVPNNEKLENYFSGKSFSLQLNTLSVDEKQTTAFPQNVKNKVKTWAYL